MAALAVLLCDPRYQIHICRNALHSRGSGRR